MHVLYTKFMLKCYFGARKEKEQGNDIIGQKREQKLKRIKK